MRQKKNDAKGAPKGASFIPTEDANLKAASLRAEEVLQNLKDVKPGRVILCGFCGCRECPLTVEVYD